jgi:hypothetical protein
MARSIAFGATKMAGGCHGVGTAGEPAGIIPAGPAVKAGILGQ